MPLPPIEKEYLLDLLVELLNTPSPTGYTSEVVELLIQYLEPFSELEISSTRKGTLVAKWPGNEPEEARALTVHLDTLGAMVKEIKISGRLKLTQIGRFAWNTIEGETCSVITKSGEKFRGTVLIHQSSSHVYGKEVSEAQRDEGNMEVRLDARTTSAQETQALGIEVGDFVALDPRVEIINGFIRSRHLDDKACVSSLVAAVKSLHNAGLKPSRTTYLHFSNYEETGHGAATGIPPDVSELLVVDMAPVGDGQNSDEFYASLCVKDSGGPYHLELGRKLLTIAERFSIPHKIIKGRN